MRASLLKPLPPLRGSDYFLRPFPRLTPWATALSPTFVGSLNAFCLLPTAYNLLLTSPEHQRVPSEEEQEAAPAEEREHVAYGERLQLRGRREAGQVRLGRGLARAAREAYAEVDLKEYE